MRRPTATLALVWFVAFNLRSVIFGMPPVLPAVRADLGLSFAATGAMTALVLLVLALGSIPGALLASRVPARRLVTICGIALGLFAGARLLPPQSFWVFAGTILLTLAVAFAQPALAVLIRRWFPDRITTASNLYGNGLMMGNVGGASLTPYVALLAGWRGTFLGWGAAALAGALLWWRLTPRKDSPAPPARIRAALLDPRAWQVTALFVFQNLAFFTVATWLPFLLRGQGPGYVAFVFLCLNCFPVLPLLVLPALRWDYPLSAGFYVLAGALTAAGAGGMLLGAAGLAWALAFMVGLGCAMAFIGAMTLPPLLGRDESEVAGISAVVFTFGYLLSFAGPWVAGALADRSQDVAVAFWPSVLSGVLMIVVGALAPRLLRRSRAAPVSV